MMTLLWGCAGSCLNPQTHSTSGAEPCPWSHSMMRVSSSTISNINKKKKCYKIYIIAAEISGINYILYCNKCKYFLYSNINILF